MEKLGLKYSLEDGQAMGKGQGRVDPMKEAVGVGAHRQVLSLSRVTGVSLAWVETEAGRDFQKINNP